MCVCVCVCVCVRQCGGWLCCNVVQRWCGCVCDSVEEYSDVQSLVRAAALRHPLLAPTTGESQVA